MLKNSYAIALLTFAAFGFTAMPARADRITTQTINQNAAIVGDGNYIEQNSTQLSIQNQPKSHNSRSNSRSNARVTNQVSTQDSEQNAAIVGNDNYLEQSTTQVNVQNQPNSHSNSRSHNSRNNSRNSRNNSVLIQDNSQRSQQNAGVVGDWNDLRQDSNQINVQQRKKK